MPDQIERVQCLGRQGPAEMSPVFPPPACTPPAAKSRQAKAIIPARNSVAIISEWVSPEVAIMLRKKWFVGQPHSYSNCLRNDASSSRNFAISVSRRATRSDNDCPDDPTAATSRSASAEVSTSPQSRCM